MFTLLLHERELASLADMINDAIKVEVNLTATRRKNMDEGEWRMEDGDRRKNKEPEQPSSSKSQDARMDMMWKTIDKLMERLSLGNKPPDR